MVSFVRHSLNFLGSWRSCFDPPIQKLLLRVISFWYFPILEYRIKMHSVRFFREIKMENLPDFFLSSNQLKLYSALMKYFSVKSNSSFLSYFTSKKTFWSFFVNRKKNLKFIFFRETKSILSTSIIFSERVSASIQSRFQ